MIAGIICYSIFGMVIGVVFSIFFINFDKMWTKILSSLLSVGGSGSLIVIASNYFGIIDQDMKFWTAASLYLMFLVSFIIMMFILCNLIKDKDDTDILRIRDILLGKKSYIDKYYEKREREIDISLGIPILEEREKNIKQRETALIEKEKLIEEEKEEISKIGKNILRINIPYNHKIVLTKDLLNSMPEYIYGLGKFIVDLQVNTEQCCNNIHSLDELKTYLYMISTFIIKDIFETNSDSIRVHFRYYNSDIKSYETLTVINGKEIVTKKLTPIPYNNSLIEKSYECQRALIKSINPEFVYQSNNYTVWQDYMTYSFYNFIKDKIPILTFGISVKNKTIHKNVFYFLSYFNIEQYLEEAFVKINENYKIEEIIYGGINNGKSK